MSGLSASDRDTELPLVPLQSTGTGNPRHFVCHNIKIKYRKRTEKPKEVVHLCSSVATEHSENKTRNYGLAMTKAGIHLFSIQMLPNLTCRRGLLPAGAGHPTKLMAPSEKFWQALDPCPLASTCSTRGKHNEDLLLLVACVEIQPWG